jgi:Fe2+ transport system protein FeoA
MELGIIPGTRVQVLRIAPFGDPLELTARGCNLSIRAAEAREVRVRAVLDERTDPRVSLVPDFVKSLP